MSDSHSLNDENFDKTVKESTVPVLIDFWAPWCGPCQIISPIVDEVAKEMGDKVKIYKINVDECPQTSMKYSIFSIPTLMIFKNGEQKDILVGVQPKERLIDALNKTL